MRVEAEQYVLPLPLGEQMQMSFMTAPAFCPFWAFAWWAVCHVHGRDMGRVRWMFHPRFRHDLPVMVAEIEKASRKARYL